MTTTTESGSSRRIQGLDLLRGIAVGLVMLQHTAHAQSGYGFGLSSGVVGVTMFFALSGYLITGILLRDMTRHDRVRYGRFYAHRALRLYPALAAMLACYVLFSLLFPELQPDPSPVTSALVGITYTADVPHLASLTYSVGHLWSLAVEEQFYLLWPTLLLLAWRRRRVATFVLIALGCAELATAVGPAIGRSAFELYYYPTSWGVALVVGAAATVFERRLDVVLCRSRAHMAAVTAAIVVLVAWSLIGNLNGRDATYWLGAPMLAVSSVVIIFWVKHWAVLPSAALRPIYGLGVVSYAAYLWNLPISAVVLARDLPTVVAGLLSVVLTVVAALASWVWIERPIRDWRATTSRREAAADGPAAPAEGRHA